MTDEVAQGKARVVEIQRMWEGGRLGVEVRLVLGREGPVHIVEVESGALVRVGEHLGTSEYPVYAADGRPVTPLDGEDYLDAVYAHLSYGSRLWATAPFEMDEAAALSGVSQTKTS